MSKKSYNIEYGPTWWECTVEIDHTRATDKVIRTMVEYWTGWEERLDNNDGDYNKTFLQQLAREINYIQIQDNVMLKGVLKEFENREGWLPMDGSYGIEITHIDDFTFEHNQYQVQEGVEV